MGGYNYIKRSEIMTNMILYLLVATLLLVSFLKDKQKTKMALKKAWKAFENILPELLGIFIIIGIVLALLSPELIGKIIGGQSGWFGVALSALMGAITLIPGFIAFPMSSLLLQNGAGYVQIAAFVSSLMMVGIVTIPVEMQYFGKKLPIWRNILAFIFSFFVAYIMGRVMGI